MAVDELEKKYTRVNLPEVTVRKIDDLSKGKHANAKEHAPKTKPAQIEEQTVRALSEEEVQEALTASTFGGSKIAPREEMELELETMAVKELLDNKEFFIYITPKGRKWLAADGFGAEDLDVLRAECIDLRDENKKLRNESVELRKTISKMQQQHEAEVADLKDSLMEKEAECNAIRKSKNEILQEREQYSDALDNDSVAFDEILSLAETVQLVATASSKLAKQIIAKTEERI